MTAKIKPRLNGTSSVTNHNGVTDVAAFVFSPQPPALSPEKAMAGSVLRQAAYDLRRFRGATSGVERELYLDAYDWVTANDFSWPYSFVNICQFLNLAPETLRQELLDDTSVGLFGYLSRRCVRAARSLQNFSNRVFTKNRRSTGADPVPLTHVPIA
jgi:AraC-like DNA-binding protein